MRLKRRLNVMSAILVSSAVCVQAGVIEKPVAMEGAMVSVTISDLHGFIDGIGGVAAQISPMASGMMIKNMAGMQLGDPGLAGISPGKGLAIVVLDQTNVFAVLEVNEAQSAAYKSTLIQQGLQARYTDGVLMAAKSAEQLDRGTGQIETVKATLLGKRSPSLRILAQPATSIAENSEAIEGMMGMLPMMMGMGMLQQPGVDPATLQSTMKILEGEILVLMSLAKQCETFEAVLLPINGSLRLDQTIVPLEGSRLATLLNAPKVTTPNPKVRSGMLGEAAIGVDCTLANPEALTSFLCEEMSMALTAAGMDSNTVAQFNESIKGYAGLYNGSLSENIGFGGETFMNIAYALDIKDEAETMARLRSMEQDMAFALDLYESLGMPMTFKFMENVRDHKGIGIHQCSVHVDMPAQQMAAGAPDLNFSNMVYDIAICEGLLLYAMGDTKIETLIDRAKDPEFKAVPLKARSIYPADAIYYVDVDMARYLEGMASIMPAETGNPLPQMAAMFQGAEPVTAAGFRENGMVKWSLNVPGSLLARVGQAAMAMQMQQMQQSMQQAPQQLPNTFEPTLMPNDMPAGLETVPQP